MSKILSFIAIALIAQATSVWAQPAMPEILPLREQAELRDRWLLNRLNSIVPSLMEREQIDMWVVIASEYNEDPVIRTMLPATWMAGLQPPNANLYISVSYKNKFQRVHLSVLNLFKLV